MQATFSATRTSSRAPASRLRVSTPQPAVRLTSIPSRKVHVEVTIFGPAVATCLLWLPLPALSGAVHPHANRGGLVVCMWQFGPEASNGAWICLPRAVSHRVLCVALCTMHAPVDTRSARRSEAAVLLALQFLPSC